MSYFKRKAPSGNIRDSTSSRFFLIDCSPFSSVHVISNKDSSDFSKHSLTDITPHNSLSIASHVTLQRTHFKAYSPSSFAFTSMGSSSPPLICAYSVNPGNMSLAPYYTSQQSDQTGSTGQAEDLLLPYLPLKY